ncbi:MAG: 4-alpha-glucanotransferase, partial [Betaproteobacteria bacterium]|nr:4-alpha-glucanotransferase [Betaproteobacteria bacterium]
HRDEVEFHEYLQWQAELQLAAAGRRSWELGLGVGIYQDLALGADAGGAETWGNRALYADSVSIGAPPDDFSLKGQDWGLPPFIPERLVESGYEPFIAALRANMRYAGALRIDHVMGLARLFWVPSGRDPGRGAYVSYPLGDLLGILALESERNRCLVIGEDLGTVPEVIWRALPELGALSYRVLYFEKEPDGNFKAPAAYPVDALVAVSTHDLPTLRGYWLGRDLEVREQLGLFPSVAMRDKLAAARARDRTRLLVALQRHGLLPEGVGPDPAVLPDLPSELLRALHVFLARAPAKVMVVQLEDALGQAEQANLPGSMGRHPNWRHRLALDFERWTKDERVLALMEALRAVRGAAPHAR